MLGQVFTFPEAATIMEIERERQLQLDAQSAGSAIFPIVEERGDTILWEVRDNVLGLSYVREGNEPYPILEDVGSKRFALVPAKFGGSRTLSADKINRGRKIGTHGESMDVSAEMEIIMQEIAERDFNTIEYIRWRMACLGDVLLPKKDGTTIRVAKYDANTTNSNVAWTDRANATPLLDLQTLRNATAGYGFDFGGGAKAYSNSITLDHLVLNTNALDLGRQRLTFGETIRDISQVNRLILQGMNLPQFEAIDGGYLDSSGVFQRFIPDGYVVIVGNHWSRGLRAGEFVMSSNEALMGEPGVYANIDQEKKAPRLPYAERGFNGGPRVNHGRQIQILKAY